MVLVGKQSFSNYEEAMVDFWTHHLRRNGIADGKAFGFSDRSQRRASPFHLHIAKTKQGYHCILTAFNAAPSPCQDFWEKHAALFQSCLSAYGGKIFSSKEGDEYA